MTNERENVVGLLRELSARHRMGDSERFEADAKLFYQQTYLIAPGRSIPEAMNAGDAYERERQEAWDAWTKRRAEYWMLAIDKAADALASAPSAPQPTILDRWDTSGQPSVESFNHAVDVANANFERAEKAEAHLAEVARQRDAYLERSRCLRNWLRNSERLRLSSAPQKVAQEEPTQANSTGLIERITRYLATSDDPTMIPCAKCGGRGYYHGFGEQGRDPDWCSDCGGIGSVLHPDENVNPDDLLKLALEALSSSAPVERPQSDHGRFMFDPTCPECRRLKKSKSTPVEPQDEPGMRTITIADFTSQEQELACEIADLEAVVGLSDWFLRSVVDGKRRSLNRLVSQRIVDDRDRFLAWKRATGIGRSDDLDGLGVVDVIASHASRTR